MARRQKFTPDQVIEAIKANKGMVYLAARSLKCEADTIYNYAKRYASVQDAIDAERGVMLDTAELALWKAIQDGESWAIQFALRTIGKERGFVEKQQVEHIDVTKMSDEELRAIIAGEGSSRARTSTAKLRIAK